MSATREKTYREITELAERARQVIEQAFSSWMVAEDEVDELESVPTGVNLADAASFLRDLEDKAEDFEGRIASLADTAYELTRQVNAVREDLRNTRHDLGQ